MLPWKLRKCQILPVNQNLSSVYFSLAKFQLVRCNPSLAMIWQMTCTHKLPKLCSAALIKYVFLIMIIVSMIMIIIIIIIIIICYSNGYIALILVDLPGVFSV